MKKTIFKMIVNIFLWFKSAYFYFGHEATWGGRDKKGWPEKEGFLTLIRSSIVNNVFAFKFWIILLLLCCQGKLGKLDAILLSVIGSLGNAEPDRDTKAFSLPWRPDAYVGGWLSLQYCSWHPGELDLQPLDIKL